MDLVGYNSSCGRLISIYLVSNLNGHGYLVRRPTHLLLASANWVGVFFAHAAGLFGWTHILHPSFPGIQALHAAHPRICVRAARPLQISGSIGIQAKAKSRCTLHANKLPRSKPVPASSAASDTFTYIHQADDISSSSSTTIMSSMSAAMFSGEQSVSRCDTDLCEYYDMARIIHSFGLLS